jgi:hypothetical protein
VGRRRDRYCGAAATFLTAKEDDDGNKLRRSYLALAEDAFWTKEHEDELPDYWYEGPTGRERLKRDYRQHVPELLRVGENGEIGARILLKRGSSRGRSCYACDAALPTIARNATNSRNSQG